MPAELERQSFEGATTGSGMVSTDLGEATLMSSCPHLALSMSGVQVFCLVDTGSMVSTITESLFFQHLE